jgi:hypothetical protein
MVATTSVFKRAFFNGFICAILRPVATVVYILLNIVQCCLEPTIKQSEALFD